MVLTFSSNTAGYDGGVINVYDIAVLIFNGTSNFINNSANGDGGAVKVAGNPVTLKVDKPGIQADRFLCLAKLLARNQFWESQTVHCP